MNSEDHDWQLDALDILSGSLNALYNHQDVTVASAGSVFEYISKTSSGRDPVVLKLTVPDTLPVNWSLHATDIWAASLFLADNLFKLQLDRAVVAA